MKKTSEIIWQDTQHQVLFELIDKIKEVPFDPEILTQLKYRKNKPYSHSSEPRAISFLMQARFDPDARIRANAISILDEFGISAQY